MDAHSRDLFADYYLYNGDEGGAGVGDEHAEGGHEEVGVFVNGVVEGEFAVFVAGGCVRMGIITRWGGDADRTSSSL